MDQTFLLTLNSPGLTHLDRAVGDRKNITVTGVTETHAVLLSARLAAQGKRVLMVLPTDLRALKAGEDAAQLLPGQSTCLPGGEVDLTRGASSHESSWRRL